MPTHSWAHGTRGESFQKVPQSRASTNPLAPVHSRGMEWRERRELPGFQTRRNHLEPLLFWFPGWGQKVTPLYDLPALQPPPSASEGALDQVLIPQKASLGHPKECHRSSTGKGRGANPGTLTVRWPPRRLAGSRRAGNAGLPRWRRKAGASLKVALGSDWSSWPLPPTAGRPVVPASSHSEHRTSGVPETRAVPQHSAGSCGRTEPRQQPEGGIEGGREGGSQGGADQECFQWVETVRSRLLSCNWRLSGGTGNLPGAACELGFGLEAAVRVAND